MPIFVDGMISGIKATFKVKLPSKLLESQKELAAAVVEGIGQIPWRETGKWLGSTNISIDLPDFSLPDPPFHTITGTEAKANLASLQIGQSPVITLPEPYTRKLEIYGWSPKAPPFSVLAAVKRASEFLPK